jgi:dihydrofolate reductase
MEGPNGEYDWMMTDPDPTYDIAASANRFDTFLLGRKTYQKLLAIGDTSFPDKRKYVFSRTLTEVAEGYTLASGQAGSFLTDLKRQSGKDIALYGGANLFASLLDLGLVDEVVLSVVPVLLGAGKPMLDPIQSRIWLKLRDSRRFANSTIELTYEVRRTS